MTRPSLDSEQRPIRYTVGFAPSVNEKLKILTRAGPYNTVASIIQDAVVNYYLKDPEIRDMIDDYRIDHNLNDDELRREYREVIKENEELKKEKEKKQKIIDKMLEMGKEI